MLEAVRANSRKAWKFYFIPGLVVGAVKFASALTWFFYHSIAAAISLTDQSHVFSDIFFIFLMGLVSVAVAIIGWPLLVYNLLIGEAPLSAMLFYPWITTL